MSSVTLPIADGNWAEVGAWLVKEGDVVSEGKVMMRYSCGGSSRQLEADRAGLVGRVLQRQGQRVRAGQAVCTIEPCPHEESFHGICTACGAEVEDADEDPRVLARGFGGREGRGDAVPDRKSFGFFGGVACSVLKRSHQGVENQQRQRIQELCAARKLALVLDLDHTLLHTTFPSNEAQRQVLLRAQVLSKDVKQLHCKGMVYFTKLRPHVRAFLSTLSQMYELYIYTAGDRGYAHAVADVLDEQKKFFPGRIISRDDYQDVAKEHKKLDKVFPIAEHWAMVLILDDNNETWDHPVPGLGTEQRNSLDNLIHCDKYSFWPRHLGETHNPVALMAAKGGGGHILAGGTGPGPAAVAPGDSTGLAPSHVTKDDAIELAGEGSISAGGTRLSKSAVGQENSSSDGFAGLPKSLEQQDSLQESAMGGRAGAEVEGAAGQTDDGTVVRKEEGVEWVSPEVADCGDGPTGSDGEEQDAGEDELKALLSTDSKDDYLDTLTHVLTQLHSCFYANRKQAAGQADVRVLLAQRQQQVLRGVTVAFSGVFKHPAEYARRLQLYQKGGRVVTEKFSRMWTGLEEAGVALSLGAELSNDVNECTHLVVVRRDESFTDKLLDALSAPAPHQAPIEIVRPDWLFVSKALWKRADEDGFRPGGSQGWEEIKTKAAPAVAERQRQRGLRGKKGEGQKAVAEPASRKRARGDADVNCSGDLPAALTPSAEKALVADAQNLLADLDSLLGNTLGQDNDSAGEGAGRERAQQVGDRKLGHEANGNLEADVVDSEESLDSDELLAELDDEDDNGED